MTIFKNIFTATMLLLFSQNLYADTKEDVALAGDIMVALIPAATISKIAYEHDGTGAIEFTASIATTMAATLILKYTIDAERPNGEDNLSFPSGHSSSAFSSATFLQMRYGWKYGVPAYIAATFVAWSRVYSDHHYTRDVIAGAALGVVGSYIFTTTYESDIQVTPLVDNGVYGLSISSSFSSY
jgi:membrane-associated phospholipid phosphatase